MVEERYDPDGGGLRDFLPRWGWAVVIVLFSCAAIALLIPDELVTNAGISFGAFFWGVVAVQGIAVFGIIAVILYNVVD
jgi:hypothetical protein